jgi:hypothetical protein
MLVVAVDVVEYSQRTPLLRAMQSAAIYIVAPRRRRSTTAADAAAAFRPPTFRQRCPPPSRLRLGHGTETGLQNGGECCSPPNIPRETTLYISPLEFSPPPLSSPAPPGHHCVVAQDQGGTKNDDDRKTPTLVRRAIGSNGSIRGGGRLLCTRADGLILLAPR